MKKIVNGFCVILAFACITVGAIGIVLPIVPTTPFFLLALVLFGKGSKRFHNWFMTTGLYKKYLEDYVRTKAMTVKAKRSILLMLSILFLCGIIFTPILWAKIIIAVVWIGHLYLFLFRIKTANKYGAKE